MKNFIRHTNWQIRGSNHFADDLTPLADKAPLSAYFVVSKYYIGINLNHHSF